MADYASKNLEAMNPPLFLRFLNLLMNDAIFLLDEAIQVKKGNIACVPIPFTVIDLRKHVKTGMLEILVLGGL